jgi:S-adenosylmethionine:tRNA ribosyltransferase-isomerase
VLNNTKVIPANLVGRKEEGGAKVEILLVRRTDVAATFRSPISGSLKTAATVDSNTRQIWECLVKPGKRLKVGSKVVFGGNEVIGTVLEKTDSGEQIIEFEGDLDSYMHKNGEIPLPPYINTKSQIPNNRQAQNSKTQLSKRYQTVFAEKEGASAAPTAGLHFTNELLEKIKAKGVNVTYITLHTGLATFKPVYAENVEEHKMYSEYYEVPRSSIEAIKSAKRVIAVGTTAVRTIESVTELIDRPRGHLPPVIKGETNLFIYPGYKFKIVDAIITNFHWPRTSLIMLVSAFAGKDFIFRAYREAMREKYRFFSFGDAMLIQIGRAHV